MGQSCKSIKLKDTSFKCKDHEIFLNRKATSVKAYQTAILSDRK